MTAWEYQTGTAGTCTVPAGCVLTHVICESRATDIVFANTVSWFVGYIRR